MVLILFAIIVFFFLFIGSLVFVCSVLLPQTREHALSAALWCAAWGPSSIVLLTLAGLGLFAGGLTQQRFHVQQLTHILYVLGPVYAILCFLGSAAVSSLAAWLHQLLIHRMTFALFRLYACFITAAIGSVLGWTLGFWLAANAPGHFLLSIAAMLLFSASFVYGGFRWARHLRGRPPEGLTWISREEFEGVAQN